MRKRFGWLLGIECANKPAGLVVVFMRDEQRAVLTGLDRVRCGMTSRSYGFGLRLMEDAGGASGTAIRIETLSGDSGFDYELSCD